MHFIAFCPTLLYNIIMNIVKNAGTAREEVKKEQFAFSGKKVQGADVGKRGRDLYVLSPSRFKLRGEGKEEIFVLSGGGFIKWKRGEIPFAAGDSFLADDAGEYELNGNCVFAVLRQDAE